MSFSSLGTDLVFYSPPHGHLYLISQCHLMQLELWLVGKWSIAQQPLSIAYKECFPVVMAASLWGHRWATKRVEFCSDNIAVVSVQSSGTSKDPNMMVLLHYLSLVAARSSFAFTASYTPGWDSSIADALSLFDFQRFHHLAPHAAHVATPIPPSLLEQLLVNWLKSATSI